jgi:hypothetical protein
MHSCRDRDLRYPAKPIARAAIFALLATSFWIQNPVAAILGHSPEKLVKTRFSVDVLIGDHRIDKYGKFTPVDLINHITSEWTIGKERLVSIGTNVDFQLRCAASTDNRLPDVHFRVTVSLGNFIAEQRYGAGAIQGPRIDEIAAGPSAVIVGRRLSRISQYGHDLESIGIGSDRIVDKRHVRSIFCDFVIARLAGFVFGKNDQQLENYSKNESYPSGNVTNTKSYALASDTGLDRSTNPYEKGAENQQPIDDSLHYYSLRDVLKTALVFGLSGIGLGVLLGMTLSGRRQD